MVGWKISWPDFSVTCSSNSMELFSLIIHLHVFKLHRNLYICNSEWTFEMILVNVVKLDTKFMISFM